MLKILKKREEKKELQNEECAPPLNGETLVEISDESGESDENKNADESEENEPAGESGETGAAEETAEEIAVTEGVTPEFRLEADAFAKGRGLSSERLEGGIKFLTQVAEAWRNGALTVELLDTVMKGLDYEEAVAKAFAEGELKGRNSQIEEKYMKPDDSDGLPHPSGHGGTTRSSRKVSSIFDLARSAG